MLCVSVVRFSRFGRCMSVRLWLIIVVCRFSLVVVLY